MDLYDQFSIVHNPRTAFLVRFLAIFLNIKNKHKICSFDGISNRESPKFMRNGKMFEYPQALIKNCSIQSTGSNLNIDFKETRP